jgi:hypothetical protein
MEKIQNNNYALKVFGVCMAVAIVVVTIGVVVFGWHFSAN